MRLATAMIFERGVSAMLKKQSQVSKTELQLATGNRVLSPADDPTAAARILDLNRQIDTVSQHQRNIERAASRLGLEDITLESVGNLLQRVRELTVQAANGDLSAENRAAIGYELVELRDEILGLANTRDANGEYLFSGLMGDTQSFTDTGGGTVTYNGDQGQRLLRIGFDRQIADGDNGFDVFVNIPATLERDADGDGVVDPLGTRSIFETLDMLVTAVNGGTHYPVPPAASGSAASDADNISNYLTELDTAINNILDTRARVGARQNAVDEQRLANEAFLLSMETSRSEERDLDYAEAVSRFQQELTALQASQQSFMKIQDLSLFKFL
jgi:flagellar hook-associated protein 3 FlgL